MDINVSECDSGVKVTIVGESYFPWVEKTLEDAIERVKWIIENGLRSNND